MRRWFLSYHSPDQALAERLKAGLERRDDNSTVFFAPKSLRAGGYWLPTLADEIAKANVFVLLVGEKGLGRWQFLEYCEALKKAVDAPSFPIVPVLLEGQAPPGLPFLGQLHWIVTADPSSEQSLAMMVDAAVGGGTRPEQLWRHISPYRGLAAMTEADSDFFFGREIETVEVLKTDTRDGKGSAPCVARQLRGRQILTCSSRRTGITHASGVAATRTGCRRLASLIP